MTHFAYLRVSSSKQSGRQSVDSQKSAIDLDCRSRGIRPKYFQDYATGRNTRRQQLQLLLSTVQSGDTIIVSDLSRLARNVRDTLTLIEQLTTQGVTLTCLNPRITFDSTAMSKFTLTLFAALSELESSWKSERIKNGLKLARDKGKQLGRAPDLALRQRVKEMRKTHSVIEIADELGTSRQNVYYLLDV